MLQTVIGISRALIRDQTMRRQTMFYIVLAALIMLFGGTTLFAINPREHPLGFILYWAVCGWLTICAVLLAVFDMLVIRAEARAARRKLEQEFLEPEARQMRETAAGIKRRSPPADTE